MTSQYLVLSKQSKITLMFDWKHSNSRVGYHNTSLNFLSVLMSGKHLLNQALTLLHTVNFPTLQRCLSKVDRPSCFCDVHVLMSKVCDYSFVFSQLSANKHHWNGIARKFLSQNSQIAQSLHLFV